MIAYWDQPLLFDVEPDWSTFSERITVREAPVAGREWSVDYHYAKVPPSSSSFYGAYCPDLIAVVAIGCPAGNAHGVAARYGLEEWPGNMEVTRVICHPDAPKNTASRSIAAVMRHVHDQRGLDWLFSYADTGQNHHGGIYQALNAIYLGINGDARHGYLLDGVPTHPRSIVTMFGTQAWPEAQHRAARKGRRLVKVDGLITPKHTYILPCGGPATNRAIRRALAPITHPYPKRDDVAPDTKETA